MHDSPPIATVRNRRDELADRTLELLAHDTTNPPGETRELADSIESWLDGLGLDTHRVVADPAKPNLFATLSGDRDETLLFLGHLDTVPFDEREWSREPLGERDGDRIYGRGATDMKGPMAAMLEAVRAFAVTDTTPSVGLALGLVSDEEVAGDSGLPAVLDSGAIQTRSEGTATGSDTTIRADACVIGETTCEGGRHSMTVADRGSIWLTLTASGSGAHGSRPMLGENAIDRLYRAVETIRERFGRRELSIPDDVAWIVDESVAYYAPAMGETAAEELFARPTINLGTIEGGDRINSVPTTARARLDIRLAPGVETPAVLADIRACAADCAGVEIADVSWSVGTYEQRGEPIVEATGDVARAVTGERIYRRSATGGGDAKKLRNAGIPTIEFALGTETVHAVDEYTTLDALAANAEIYASLPAQFAEAVAGDRVSDSAEDT